MNVGLMTERFSTIWSTLPSMAVAKPICACAASRTLPNECDSGSQRYCTSSTDRMSTASTAAPSYVQLAWVSCTPLGRPVVPDV